MLTVENKVHDQRWHETAFGVVHVIPVSEPAFGFHARAFFALCITLWREVRREMLGEVLGDQAGLGKNDRFFSRYFDPYNRRLTERMNLLELRICTLLGSFEDLDIVGDLAFFEQPDNTLCAGLLKPTRR